MSGSVLKSVSLRFFGIPFFERTPNALVQCGKACREFLELMGSHTTCGMTRLVGGFQSLRAAIRERLTHSVLLIQKTLMGCSVAKSHSRACPFGSLR